VQDLLGYFAASHWQVQFTSRTNWSYALEASADLKSWTPVSQDAAGNGVSLILADTNTVFSRWQFYRVRPSAPDMPKEKIIFCWSGGKDSALALHKILQTAVTKLPRW